MYAIAAGFVRKLTAGTGRRREFDACGLLRGIILVGVGLTAAVTAGAVTQAWQPPEQIASVAEGYVRDRIGPAAGRTTAKAQPIDSRHRMPLCSKPLEAFMRRGTQISERSIVGVRCAGSKPWKLYVPVDVIVTDLVLIAKRTLPKGHVLTEDDLVGEQRDVSRLRSGYISDSKQHVGQRLKTQLLAGRVLTPGMLQADIAIRRGQSVTLTVSSGGIIIQMSGKALMDGALSQRIRVENTNSGRVVEGIVRSREHVEVLVAQTSKFFNAKPKVSPRVADMRSSNNDR